jgi:hypothetical protein
MAKKKVNRVTATRRPRIPNNHMRVEVILPGETVKRLTQHCERNAIDEQNFLKKAIYDALPVHYEVTEDFIFPFGKYQGETAGAVKQFDPGYIEWCKKNISGFYDKFEPINVQADSSVEKREVARSEVIAKIQAFLCQGETLYLGSTSSSGQKAFAVRYTEWGQKKFRFLGYVPV